jgi:aryl-alcohol dehydrogenase-like predicted oxidoreductase
VQYRPLGRSGLFVSSLALGTMTWGGANAFWRNIGETDRDGAKRQLRMALEAGVNLVDTADVYSFGGSEELVGQAIADLGVAREDVLVATKARLRMGPGANRVGLSRTHLLAALDASLARLRLDHVDLWQIHGPDPLTPIEETLRAMDDAVVPAACAISGPATCPAGPCPTRSRLRAPRVLPLREQPGLLLARRPRCRARGGPASARPRGVAARLVAARRRLSLGQVPGRPEGRPPRRLRLPAGGLCAGERVLAALERVADGRGAAMAEVALAWLLARPGVASVIVGARTDDQLAANLAAAAVALSAEEVFALDEASALPPEYPGLASGPPLGRPRPRRGERPGDR